MVQPIMQRHGWGICLYWHPPCPVSDYSLLKAASGNGIDCAFSSMARSSQRSSRNQSSRTRPSVYEFRIWCSSGTGTSNSDNNNKNPIIWDAEKESIEEVYYPESGTYGTVMNNNDNSKNNSVIQDADRDGIEDVYYPESERYDDDYMDADGSGIEIQVEKIAKNRRRIQATVSVQASLDTVWNILTDYERLADFIPSLTVSQLLEKRDKFARLLQIGQQNLAFGLKFKAKGVIDCYEKDLQNFPFGQRRDIEFKMTEGDFKLFEGKWSIEQSSTRHVSEGFRTTLFYVVEVEPKFWLPVHLVQGRLCREIKMNLSCIQKAAERASYNRGPAS